MIDALLERLAALEHRVANMNVFGPVHDRDHEKGVRLRLGGTDEEPYLSPWIQPGDRTGSSRYLPDVGEQMMIVAHAGDHRQATLLPFTHSTDKPNPAADADETVFYNRNGVRFAEKAGKITFDAPAGLTLSSGGKTFTITDAGHTFTGGSVKHDDHNIGSDHQHGQVKTGGDNTGPPNP